MLVGAPCPFCAPPADQIFHESSLVLGIWDASPVSPGHALLIPRRHINTWFEATPEEQAHLNAAMVVARDSIQQQYGADGFNIGMNVGPAAGQTVAHLHIHVIPRYRGDVPNPRGGIRHVIPANGYPSPIAGKLPPIEHPAATRQLVRGGDDPLLPHLRAHLGQARRADFAVSFVLESGVQRLEGYVRDLLQGGGSFRLITSDYLDVTEPHALMRLLDLQEEAGPNTVQLWIFEATTTAFHPKAYLFYGRDNANVAYVGSSNLSQSALMRGIEWNYRILSSRDGTGFADVADAFDALLLHPSLRRLDHIWIDSYRRRRRTLQKLPLQVEAEPVEPSPHPHVVQEEALAALQDTRAMGNAVGLVVLATGLGKTWLSAFDSAGAGFERVLFVAHREEILIQALHTFRRIRPDAALGKFTGAEKSLTVDVLFASIQTLGRTEHLQRFRPDAFDYIVVDEFHHAAAPSYRRLLAYFTPRFLLGLTATPDRTDGSDLLALCQENLVYRCDLAEGIRRGLLSPFHYFGVPDDVDYRNIPWRSTRFDEEALTRAVATRARAENALDQYRRRAGLRTLAFCSSQRHADFMADYFNAAGIRSAAVHSGPNSSPRVGTMERLDAGELAVVFAVDMFNEGIDLPGVDTVMMLRPTESAIVWLQQLGRGLRRAAGKDHLTVIDYIGNHRSFLVKPRTLLEIGPGDAEIARALNALRLGTLELPPGCQVTYELETIEILKGMLRNTANHDALRGYYEDFRERIGTRPSATEAFHDGYLPRSVRPSYGSWLRFVRAMGDLSREQLAALDRADGFLDALETTQMTKSYKMVVLLAMLNMDRLPGSVAIDELAATFAAIAARSAALRTEVGAGLEDQRALSALLEENPIAAWSGGKGTSGRVYFGYDGAAFRTLFDAEPTNREALQELVRELVEWRLAEYLQRPGADMEREDARRVAEAAPAYLVSTDADSASNRQVRFTCKVSHANARPILFLPNRETHTGIPEGWATVSRGLHDGGRRAGTQRHHTGALAQLSA